MSIFELEAEALKLSPEEQAHLIHRWAVALDSSEEPELTNEELERRWTEFEASGSPGIEASELSARAEQRFGLR